MAKPTVSVSVRSYAEAALPHLQQVLDTNEAVLETVSRELIALVRQGKSLLVFGSGHSAILTQEVYHRAGGPSFVLPLVAEFLLPVAGPPVVRALERTSGVTPYLLERAEAQSGEMLWIMSQSGINHASIEIALEAKKRGLKVVAFTSKVHSQAVKSRHPSGQRLFEVADQVVDLGGNVGDASIQLTETVRGGPLSSLTAVFLAHSILAHACAELESNGVRCVYTSVNTPEGEKRNRDLELSARRRDWLLRG